jgi:hypothetical protein
MLRFEKIAGRNPEYVDDRAGPLGGLTAITR